MNILETTTPLKHTQSIAASAIIYGGCPTQQFEAEERRASLQMKYSAAKSAGCSSRFVTPLKAAFRWILM